MQTGGHKWCAKAYCGPGKQVYIAAYDTEEEAAAAFDAASYIVYGR